MVIIFVAFLLHFSHTAELLIRPKNSKVMGALSSVEHKPSSRKTRSADAVNEPRRNGLLVVVSPSETASTPSSPNRDVSLRSRSRSSDAGLPTLAADADSRRESTDFSPADNQHRSNEDDEEEEFQTRGDERATKSSDGTAPAVSSPTSSNTQPAEAFRVKPSPAEQPARNAIDDSRPLLSDSALASTRSDSSSVTQEPTQLANSGGTRARPKLQDVRARRSSEAITDIAQAKKVAHRTVVAQTEKAGVFKATKGQPKPVQHKHIAGAAATTPPPNGAAAGELSERCSSPNSTKSQQSTRQSNSGGRSRELKQQNSSEEQQTRRHSDMSTKAKKPAQQVTVARSEQTPSTSGDSNEHPTQRREEKPVAKSATSPKDEPKQSQPEMKVEVPSKPDTGTAAPASDVSRKSTSTKAGKSAHKKAQFSQPVVVVGSTAASNNDEDDDDEWDWQNLISALRDPDDVRTRKVEPRRSSTWGKPAKPVKEKGAKDKTNTTEEDDDDKEEEEEVNVFLCLYNAMLCNTIKHLCLRI